MTDKPQMKLDPNLVDDLALVLFRHSHPRAPMKPGPTPNGRDYWRQCAAVTMNKLLDDPRFMAIAGNRMRGAE